MSGAGLNTLPGAGGGSNNPNVTVPYGARRMPKPGEKNAPVFDPEKPEELGRFFERIEDWFQEDGIVSDDTKKKRIVRYLDADSEIQWKAFSKFENGTYADFKTQVLAAYPKAVDVLKGSVTALKRRIKQIGPVDVDERDELSSLIRIVRAEVAKLKLIKPPIHTNRELVELFLSRLTKEFASRIAHKLSVQRLVHTANPNTTGSRNPEDMYDIEDVMSTATETAMESANPFGKFLWTAAGSSSETSVKLEEAVARLTDTINMQSQYNRQVDQKLANLQSFMSQPKPASAGGFMAQNGYGRGLAPSSNQIYAGRPSDCFYCRGDHRIPDCTDVLRHLDMGWIKRIEGKLRLPNGETIPRDGNKTMKEVVEALNKLKPGLIQMAKLQEKASFPQETAGINSFVQTHEQSADDLNMRALLEVVQKLGTDKVLKLLNSQLPGVEEEDEWNQNFD